jgi:hypothetical protein
MLDKFKDSHFALLYVWMSKAKYTMGIFFVVFVVFYLFFGLIGISRPVTLDFITAIEMLFACLFIGIAQRAITPADKPTKARCVIWILSGGCITLIFSVAFGWFAVFAPWCIYVFMCAVMLGMGAMVLGYYLQLNHETRDLNRRLEQYQRLNFVQSKQEKGE